MNLDESSTDKTDTNWKEELLPKGKKKKKVTCKIHIVSKYKKRESMCAFLDMYIKDFV